MFGGSDTTRQLLATNEKIVKAIVRTKTKLLCFYRFDSVPN